MDDVNIGLYAGDLTYDPPDKNKKIGVIALTTDVTAERDFARILPMERLGVYVTRVALKIQQRLKICVKWHRLSPKRRGSFCPRNGLTLFAIVARPPRW